MPLVEECRGRADACGPAAGGAASALDKRTAELAATVGARVRARTHTHTQEELAVGVMMQELVCLDQSFQALPTLSLPSLPAYLHLSFPTSPSFSLSLSHTHIHTYT